MLIYLVTAFFSDGYHHPDEHHQILEFCNYKLGNIAGSDLPWEFKEQARQALPVFITYVFIKGCYLINITNPFTIVTLLRLIMALLVWATMRKLCNTLIGNFKHEITTILFVVLLMLLWFVPYISVRFSSENLSSIAFLWAIYLIVTIPISSKEYSLILIVLAGFLLGLAFFFRFQLGFAFVGLALWLVVIKKIKWKPLLLLFLGGVLAIIFCTYLDFWFYGNWLFSPINYFRVNIFEGRAASFGVDPWWYYIYLFIIQSLPPISIVLFLFFLVGIYKNPTNIFLWCLIPFLIAHSLVGHKEMRFMFPMLFGFLYIVALGIDSVVVSGRWRKAFWWIFLLCFVINMPILFFKMVTPAQEAIRYYKFLYSYAEKKEVTLYCLEKDAYELGDLKINFYKSPAVHCVVYKDEDEFSNFLDQVKPDSAIYLQRKLAGKKTFNGYENQRGYCLFPPWILRYNINNWEDRARVWDIRILNKVK